MNKLYSMLNASSIMSNLMLRNDFRQIQLTKGKYHTMISIYFNYADSQVYQLRNELQEVVPENCSFQIKDFEDSETCDAFTTLEITWEYDEE